MNEIGYSLNYFLKASIQSLKEKRSDMEIERPWPLDVIDDELVEELIEDVR